MKTDEENESSGGRFRDVLDPKLFTAVLQETSDAIVVCDPQERITYWNPAAEQIYGWTAQEALGKLPAELFWPVSTPDEQENQKQRQWRLTQGETLRGEHTCTCKDGSLLRAAYTCRPFFDRDGVFSGTLTVYRDLSARVQSSEDRERVRAEQALRESEERYRRLVKHAPSAIYEIDLKTMHFTEVNDAMCEILGYARQELMAMRPSDLLDEESKKRFQERIVQTWSDEKIAEQTEYKIRAKDGREIWGVLNTTVNYEEGVPKSVSVIAHDITERKRAEQALRDSEQRYREIIESTHEGVWILDLNGVTTYVNSQMAALLGYTPEEMIGRNAFDFVSADDMDRGQQEWKQRQVESHGRQSEYRYRHKDGHAVWCLVNSNTIMDAQGRSMGILGMFSDITERKRAEQALRENEKQLQLLNETLEQKVQDKTEEVRRLAAEMVKAVQRERHRISHILHDDLQQRIYAVLMQLTFLRYELEQENEAAHQEVSEIEAQLEEALKITRQVSIDLSPPILQNEGLTQAVNWLAAQMHQRYGLPIEIRAEESFVIPNKELHVLLFNCIREILFNIVKHAHASQAVVTLQRADNDLQIEVCDNGQGILVSRPEEQNERDASQVTFGLPTIRHQLRLFGGQMDIESESGAGTRVILTVPVAPEE